MSRTTDPSPAAASHPYLGGVSAPPATASTRRDAEQGGVEIQDVLRSMMRYKWHGFLEIGRAHV